MTKDVDFRRADLKHFTRNPFAVMPAGASGLREIHASRVLRGRLAHFELSGTRADVWIVQRCGPERRILGVPSFEIAVQCAHPFPSAQRDGVGVERSLSAEKGATHDGDKETGTERGSRGMHENSVVKNPGIACKGLDASRDQR